MPGKEPRDPGGPNCELIAYSGGMQAWVERLASALATSSGRRCTIVGIGEPPADSVGSICRSAWLFDAARNRRTKWLDPAGTGTVQPESRARWRIDLVGSACRDDCWTLQLRVGDRPAAQLRHSLEVAWLAGRGEIELCAIVSVGSERRVVKRRCALVDWSISVSLDRVIHKLVGLAASCLSESGHCDPAHDIETHDDALTPPITLTSAFDRTFKASLRSVGRHQWGISVHQHVKPNALFPTTDGTTLTPPADRFWADPFVARDGDTLWVFFEELIYARPKGRICCVPIDRDGTAGAPIEVLEEKWHLSYPNVFKVDGVWYMLPEASASRQLTLYRAQRFPDRWEPVSRLLSDVRVVDATLVQHGNAWWLLAGSSDSPGGAFDDTLHIYRATNPLGPWEASPCNPVRSDPSCARPAGPVFTWNGQAVRPVQDCRGRYGRAVHLLAMDGIDNHGPRDRLIATIHGDDAAGFTAAHTYSRVGTDLALDWQRWRWLGSRSRQTPSLVYTAYGTPGSGS